MEAPERVVWSEGMLMSPQHLQQQDLFHARNLEARLSALTPQNWGVLELEIDAAALSAGQVGVSRFSGVMPGGLPLEFGGNRRNTPPARAVESHFAPTDKSLQVFVGVAREREGVANVGDSESQGSPRYKAAARKVGDLTGGGGGQTTVTFAQPNPVLLFNNEANADFESIKIAEIVRDENGELKASPEFAPPCLEIGASPYLAGGIKKLLGLAVARQRNLMETTRARSGATLEFRSSDITNFLQLSALNSFVPVLQHLTDNPRVNPWQAYMYLVQAAGQLMAFSADADPTGLPKFDYKNLGGTFKELFSTIEQLLTQTVHKRSVKVKLQLYRNGVMVGDLPEDRLANCQTFVLAAKPDESKVSREKLASELPKLSKVAAKSNIKSIVQAASNGVPIEVTHRPPPEIPVRDGVVYFSVSTSDAAWRTIRDERNIALFMPSPFNPGNVKYELMAVPQMEN